jgi:hypothetical protein
MLGQVDQYRAPQNIAATCHGMKTTASTYQEQDGCQREAGCSN